MYKLKIVQKQKYLLCNEIDEFITKAIYGLVQTKDEKLKLYNKADIMGKVAMVKSIARAIEELGKKNVELWNLEDSG